MELKLEIHDREIGYSLKGISGKGLKNLVAFIGEHEFGSIEISGETKSYSFLRQIALLVNLLIKTKQVRVSLKSKSFIHKDTHLFPIYE